VNDPLVSCLVTAFGYERFLAAAVESALAQDYPALEVVIVNDGSTDGTGAVADALAARHPGRVRVVHQANGGWTNAFNRAISEAHGELYAILDADDTWLPGKLRAQVDPLAARPEVGLAYSDLAVIDEHGATVEPSFWTARGVDPFSGRCAAGLVTKGNTATTSSVLVRASLRDAFFPIPDEVPYGDWWVAFRTACVSELAFVREPLTGYRFHGANLTLNAEGGRLVRELTKEHHFRRAALARLEAGVLDVAETVRAYGALESSARAVFASAGSVFRSLPPGKPAEARAEVAAADGAAPLAALPHLLRAVALDPWDDDARDRFVAAAEALADRPEAREEPAPEGFMALGFLDEIVGAPELLADYARVFDGRTDATLVVLAPGFDGAELGTVLAPVASALGLDRDGSAEVVVLTEDGAGERLATVADALYTRVGRNGCFHDLPQISEAEALLELALGEPAPDRFARSILADAPPWAAEELPAETVPGMITDEEKRYFRWIGRTFTGEGAVVELGPWLSCSTHHIVAGLERSRELAGRRLHVYDDFVWRSAWMDGYYALPDRPGNHEDFRPIFERYAAPLAGRLDVEKVKLADYDGNESLPLLEWRGGPVELIYVDCGRTFEANEAWWRIFSPHFVPGKTLVIMQDWQLYKEQPPQPWNQTKQFTDSKGAALELVHELRDGAVGAFRYHGEPNLRAFVAPRAEEPVAGPPDFVGVAAQKAGTTWWFDLITQHPSVRYPATSHWKEARVFVDDWKPGAEDDLVARYLEQFPRGPGEVTGEWTPDYLHFAWVPELIARAAPEAKLLAIVRDPVERYVSAIAHMLTYDIPIRRATLAEAFRGGLYARQLGRLLGLFPAEQLLVLQYERLKAEPHGELARTYAFLGLGAFEPEDVRRPVHATAMEKPVLPPGLRGRLVDRYRADAEELPELVRGAVDLSLWRSLD
jgi:hypothetical protein